MLEYNRLKLQPLFILSTIKSYTMQNKTVADQTFSSSVGNKFPQLFIVLPVQNLEIKYWINFHWLQYDCLPVEYFCPFWEFKTGKWTSSWTKFSFLIIFDSGNSLEILLFPESKIIKKYEWFWRIFVVSFLYQSKFDDFPMHFCASPLVGAIFYSCWISW